MADNTPMEVGDEAPTSAYQLDTIDLDYQVSQIGWYSLEIPEGILGNMSPVTTTENELLDQDHRYSGAQGSERREALMSPDSRSR